MKKLLFIIATAVLVLSGCTKSADGPGRLIVKITDDPFNINIVESATITINKIEIGKSGEDNQFIVVSENTMTFNLMELRNGITAEIGNIEIPQGNYDQIRLYVQEAGLKLKEHAGDYKVKVPSGDKTGLKLLITPSLTVDGGLTSELLLDFDLSKSFVMRGNINHAAGVNGFIFKPTVKVTNSSTAGRLEGIVADPSKLLLENAKVWIAKDTVFSSAFTDVNGRYVIPGVPSGTYSVFATKENYDTVSFEKISIISANRTIQDFILTKK